MTADFYSHLYWCGLQYNSQKQAWLVAFEGILGQALLVETPVLTRLISDGKCVLLLLFSCVGYSQIFTSAIFT